MKALVADTSVLIDLERGALLEAGFLLPFQLVVPDLLYERELKEHGGDDLRRRGLMVEELDASGVLRALGYRRKQPALSLPDSFALALAADRGWTLLTGDRALREPGQRGERRLPRGSLAPRPHARGLRCQREQAVRRPGSDLRSPEVQATQVGNEQAPRAFPPLDLQVRSHPPQVRPRPEGRASAVDRRGSGTLTYSRVMSTRTGMALVQARRPFSCSTHAKTQSCIR